MSQTLKVLTYNIHHGEGWMRDEPTFTGFADLEQIAGIIRSSGADIVALQEVDRVHPRSGAVDQTTVLAELLDMHACFGSNLSWADGSEYGVATLSRYPIRSHVTTAFPNENGLEPRGVLKTVVEVPGFGDVVVLNTHLQFAGGDQAAMARAERRQQAEAIARMIEDVDGAVILMGDFNADPADPELEPLTHLKDAWVEAGRGGEGLTIPGHPMLALESRIDVVFVNDALHVVSARVLDDGSAVYGSDHLPVLAEVRR